MSLSKTDPPLCPTPAAVDAIGQIASLVARYPVSQARAASLSNELLQLNNAVREAASTLQLSDEPLSFAAYLERDPR